MFIRGIYGLGRYGFFCLVSLIFLIASAPERTSMAENRVSGVDSGIGGGVGVGVGVGSGI